MFQSVTVLPSISNSAPMAPGARCGCGNSAARSVPAGDFEYFLLEDAASPSVLPHAHLESSDASFSIHPARSGNSSTVVQLHPLAQAGSVLGKQISWIFGVKSSFRISVSCLIL